MNLRRVANLELPWLRIRISGTDSFFQLLNVLVLGDSDVKQIEVLVHTEADALVSESSPSEAEIAREAERVRITWH
jgi:hypothetical protein